MALRDLPLRQQYRSDKDNVVTEFFIPCLTNCIRYDRTIEYISVKSLFTLSSGIENIQHDAAKIRLISGHRFRTSDLNVLKNLFEQNDSKKMYNGNLIRNNKIDMLKETIQNHRLEVKIAIPNSEEIDGSFRERIGIFYDKNDDSVAFTGTSNETFDSENRNFESVDVFTSWDDKKRIENKINDFENLWQNKTKYVQVFDFEYAEQKNLLKYSTEWALDI